MSTCFFGLRLFWWPTASDSWWKIDLILHLRQFHGTKFCTALQTDGFKNTRKWSQMNFFSIKRNFHITKRLPFWLRAGRTALYTLVTVLLSWVCSQEGEEQQGVRHPYYFWLQKYCYWPSMPKFMLELSGDGTRFEHCIVFRMYEILRESQRRGGGSSAAWSRGTEPSPSAWCLLGQQKLPRGLIRVLSVLKPGNSLNPSYLLCVFTKKGLLCLHPAKLHILLVEPLCTW